MRVYELAKQLGMENRDLIPELKRLGITVASHSSALEPDAVQKALEKLGPKHKTAVKSTTKGAETDSGHADRHKESDAGPHHQVGVKGAHPAATEESKPDKRRILIKRKRTDEAQFEARTETRVEPGQEREHQPPDRVVDQDRKSEQHLH